MFDKKKKTVILLNFILLNFINVILIVYIERYNKAVSCLLLLIQFLHIVLLIIAYSFIKQSCENFLEQLYFEIDSLLSNNPNNIEWEINDSPISSIFHQLCRLYEVLSANKRNIISERDKLQNFISDIAHQVKTPITNLKLLHTTLLNTNLVESERQKYLILQEAQLNKLDFLIQSLIKSSRLENDIIKLFPEMKSINSTIISALEGILIEAEDKGIEVSFDNSIEYTILHDVKWTTEALFNILDNAIKYTPPNGKIDIFINVHSNYLQISIRDTGIGIAEKDIPQIFNRFWRGNPEATAGTGIGLYLTKKIISLQDGYILVNSALNTGTCFNLFMPYKQ